MSLRNRLLLAIAIVSLLAPALPAAPAPAVESVDLRGPAPKKGMVLLDKFKFTMTNADVELDVGNGMKISGKMDMTTFTEKQETILGVDGRNITKLRTKVIEDSVDRTTTIAGEKQKESENKALKGEIIFSELTKNGWKHSLEDASPSDKQKKELKDFDNPENDDDMFPAEKVKPGHAWDIDPKAFKKIFGSKMTEAKGTGKAKFVRIEKFDGEPCAVIEMDVDIKAKLKQEDGDFDVEMKGKIESFRSIAEAIDLKYSFKGKAKFAGNVEEKCAKFKIEFSGAMTGDGTTKIEKK
jgi:hypothetical protein